MKYYVITPITNDPSYLVFSKFMDYKNEIINLSSLDNNSDVNLNYFKSNLYLDGIIDKLMYNIDLIPIVKKDLMDELKKCNLGKVIFYPVINDIVDNVFAMLVYNNYDCINIIKSPINIPFFNLDQSKIYSEIFRIKDHRPLYVSENVINVIKELNIKNIDITEVKTINNVD